MGAQVWDFERGELLQETLLDEGVSSTQDNLLIHQSFELPNGSNFTAWKWAESETWITNSNDVYRQPVIMIFFSMKRSVRMAVFWLYELMRMFALWIPIAGTSCQILHSGQM